MSQQAADEVVRMIELTANHTAPSATTRDASFFLDFDLEILGSSRRFHH